MGVNGIALTFVTWERLVTVYVLGKEYTICSLVAYENTQYVVCFILANSPASEYYIPTFRNTLSVQSS